MNCYSRRSMLTSSLLGMVGLTGCAATLPIVGPASGARRSSFTPGEVWLDTAGKPIQAHAGSIIAIDKTFYWYGENKEFTDGTQGRESWGIRFYRSNDLYNWEDLGPVIPPDIQDPSSPMSPTAFPERPHILFNPRTGKLVCWIKIRNPKLTYSYRTVFIADAITGPWKMVQRELKPAGMSAGDFDLAVDPETGKAYMYFEHDHKDVICVELTEDWTSSTDRTTVHFTGSRPPFTPEGIACFQRNQKLYLTSSQMTGYFPNRTKVAVADGIGQSLRDLGYLHNQDKSESSFNSQISSIFKHPGKRDLYIALADRWLPQFTGQPDFESGEVPSSVFRAIQKATGTPRLPLNDAERKAIPYAGIMSNVNTSVSRYVWLPLKFAGGRPSIDWQSEWRVEDYR